MSGEAGGHVIQLGNTIKLVHTSDERAEAMKSFCSDFAEVLAKHDGKLNRWQLTVLRTLFGDWIDKNKSE